MMQARTPRMRFATRVLVLQLAVVSAIVIMTAGTFAALMYQWLGDQAEERALAVARTVASSEDVRRETAALAATPKDQLTPSLLAGGPLEQDAGAAQERTEALFVVITDDDGLRLAHPNPALLGQRSPRTPLWLWLGARRLRSKTGPWGGRPGPRFPCTPRDHRRLLWARSVWVFPAMTLLPACCAVLCLWR